MKLKQPIKTICYALIFISPLGTAGEITAQSDNQTTPILELYTSEGCPNCPQAEKYLDKLNRKQANKQSYIPMAFHVDYWDDERWRDPYSNAKYSQRQRTIVQRNQLNTIYTPQFVIHGQDFPAYKNIPQAIDVVNNIKPMAAIKATVSLKDNTSLETSISIKTDNSRVQWTSDIYIAITENNLSSSITGGDNKGLSLKHNNVVRQLTGPIRMQGKSKLDIKEKIMLDKSWKLDDLTLIVFVEDYVNGKLYQSLQIALKPLQEK
ncbi:MAG: DUF1223 domain-containing protein [Gammaproteobacteria bacterium]|nr:DUF1223 domain-containing protein [Gammaproteobacteria bacterium]